jgi:hypothetical protein
MGNSTLVRVASVIALVLVIGISACSTSPAKDTPTTLPATPPAATQPAAEGRSLFDGKTLTNWKATEFGGSGEVEVKDGLLMLGTGERLTGVVWEGGELPHVNYEISLDAKRVNGSDFFCGLTFPVKDSHATLVVGGWGGALVGISSLDDEDAAHNDTSTAKKFETGKWYKIRMRVLGERLQTWIDDEKVIDISTKGVKVDVRADISDTKPLGLTSFQTTGAMKEIKLRQLSDAEVKAAESVPPESK